MQRFGAATGIFSPTLAFACILIAIASHPSFSWTNNALSDLGVISGITGLLFNFGLCASGLLALNFSAFGLFSNFKKNWAGKIGSAIFATATIALIAIGVFNEHYSGTHYAVSMAFFTLIPISMFIITSAFLLDQQVRMALFTMVTGFAAGLPWILLFAIHYVPDVAIPEFASGIIVSTWTLVVCYRILKKAN